MTKFTSATCEVREKYSRLGLRGVVSQGNALTLDFVETLLTEVVPVSKKPIFWWTTPLAITTANHRQGTEKQPPIRAGQGRAGRGGTHTGGGRGQGRSSPGSQSWCRVFVWTGVFDFAHKFRSGWLVTPKQANADITSVKKGGREWEKGKGRVEMGKGSSKWILKKREINRYRSDRDNGEKGGGERTWTRPGGTNRMRTTTNRGQRAKAKQRLASDIQW